MDEKAIEPEVEEVFEVIKKGQDFILEGGAGSGKTYSLISVIEKISKDEPEKSIVCITYTNNAVAEIRSRVGNNNLWVSTIHEFIWRIISKFQKEIKDCLVELINDEEEKIFRKPRGMLEDEIFSISYFDGVSVNYSEYYSMTPNANDCVNISHDHILILAERMFSRYVKLSDILKDTANYIFIDEYQDTSPLVVKILLEHLKKSLKRNTVGFFGDSMQAIYDSGIGDLNFYNLRKIQKNQNRRNPRKVIDLANKLRKDGLHQLPSSDSSAPNMDNGEIIDGEIMFVYGENTDGIEYLRESKKYVELGFNNPKITKELRLTHKLNSGMSGFSRLFELYNSDPLMRLIKSVKQSIDKEKRDSTKEIFERLSEKVTTKSKKNGPKLVDVVKSDPLYRSFYQKYKNLVCEDVFAKTKINDKSLLAYSFNGVSSCYEPKIDRDRILRRLDLIYELMQLYEEKKINLFLKMTKYKLASSNDKIKLAKTMELLNDRSNTIEKALRIASENGIITSDDIFDYFIENEGCYLWSRIKTLPFDEYLNSMAYLREYVSLATQHSVKGSEYENVLILLDNGGWNNYDFKTLFNQGTDTKSVTLRTKKLFYVTATRAKRNLIVYMPTRDREIIKKASDYFEENNIFDVESLPKAEI